MKTHQVALALACVVSAVALSAVAQQITNQNSSQAGQTNQAGKGLGKLDDKTSGDTIRASKLLGMNIKNSRGDGIGEIKDLVIDASGKVRYAAVEYGGFLGLGSKLFAVPFEAFQVKPDPNDPSDPDDFVLSLDVTKDQLQGDSGFDDKKWPDFADTKFAQELDRRYKVDRTNTRR